MAWARLRGGVPERAGRTARQPHLGILFDCCHVYSRIYRNRERTAYVGHCPQCSRRVEVKIAPDGTDCRFFRSH